MTNREEITITVIPTYQVIYTRGGKSLRPVLTMKEMMYAGQDEERYSQNKGKLFEASVRGMSNELSNRIRAFVDNASLIGEFDTTGFQKLMGSYKTRLKWDM